MRVVPQNRTLCDLIPTSLAYDCMDFATNYMDPVVVCSSSFGTIIFLNALMDYKERHYNKASLKFAISTLLFLSAAIQLNILSFQQFVEIRKKRSLCEGKDYDCEVEQELQKKRLTHGKAWALNECSSSEHRKFRREYWNQSFWIYPTLNRTA